MTQTEDQAQPSTSRSSYYEPVSTTFKPIQNSGTETQKVVKTPRLQDFPPEDVCPYPKAQARKRNYCRQPAKTSILIDTPVKNAIIAQVEGMRKKQQKEEPVKLKKQRSS